MKKQDWLAFFDFLLMGFVAGVGGIFVSTQASQYDEVEEFNRLVFAEPPESDNVRK